MKDTFKITYRPSDGSREYVSRLIEADSADEAREAIMPCHSIRSISRQCRGVTKSGHPCQRFTHNEYCCEEHDPRHYQHEISLDLDEACIRHAYFKGSTCYGESRWDIDAFKTAYENHAAIARYPRTQMVDRLIAFDFDIDAVRESYEREDYERRIARRRNSFRLTITALEPQKLRDDDLEIDITRNGYQHTVIAMTLDEARALRSALFAFISFGRSTTRNVNGDEIAEEK